MADAFSGPTLFGWQPQPRSDARGRPEHEPTPQKAARVISLLGLGRKPKEVAAALGISVPTLRKHYFSDWRVRSARLIIEGDLMVKLAEQAEQGNVAAIKELFKRFDKAALDELAHQVADRGRREPKAKVEKLGKKAAAKEAAQGVRGKFAPPPAPLLN